MNGKKSPQMKHQYSYYYSPIVTAPRTRSNFSCRAARVIDTLRVTMFWEKQEKSGIQKYQYNVDVNTLSKIASTSRATFSIVSVN